MSPLSHGVPSPAGLKPDTDPYFYIHLLEAEIKQLNK